MLDSSVNADSGTPPQDAGNTPDTGTPPIDGGSDAGSPVDAGPGDAGPVTGAVVRSHPCPGINRTDALWVDDDGTMFIGCGSGAVGNGMYMSTDEGLTWSIPATNPSVLDTFRVLSIHRGFGGLLYVGGQGPAMSMVVSLDTSSSPFAAEAVLTRGTTVGTSFLASPFVTTASGAAWADSFNGSDSLYRANDSVGDAAAEWTDASLGRQMIDLVAVGERFVGCGSTIAQPPYVFLPSQESGAEPWEMTQLELVSGLGAYDGEMWGVAADDDRVVVVGVNQDANVGKIFVSGADRYTASDYTQLDIDPLLPTRVSGADSTWARGVCMDGMRVVVVGEIQPLGAGDNSGFVLESTDGGSTFTDITPDGSPDTWSKCQIMDGGRVVVAGAGAVALVD
ncbi:MAG: hypothetical protein AB8I08_06215 [Sandaracinaceae bacterium]